MQITKQNWPKEAVPLVSICCITYNHENYIRDAIEGFLIQETSFPVEILINDDASPDKTAEIIKEYESKYPNLVFPLYQTENQKSKGVRPNPTFNYPRARGKYIALCEGDDYWTDPLKLQKQVGFLERNTDCSLCFHDVQKTQGKSELGLIKPKKVKTYYTTEDLLSSNGKEMATCSLVFKASLLKKIPDFLFIAPVGDFPLKLFLSEFGNIGYIPRNMGVYRYQIQNSWSSKKQFAIEQHYMKMKSFLYEYSNWSKKKNKKNIKRNCSIRKADYIRITIENSNSLKEKLTLLLRNIFSYNIYYTLINIKKIL